MALGGGMVNEVSPPRSRTNVTISGRSAQWDLAEISVIVHLAAKSSRRSDVPPCVRTGSIVLVPMRTRASGAPFLSDDPSGLGLLATAAIKGRVADSVRAGIQPGHFHQFIALERRTILMKCHTQRPWFLSAGRADTKAARHRVAAIPNRLLPSLEKG